MSISKKRTKQYERRIGMKRTLIGILSIFMLAGTLTGCNPQNTIDNITEFVEEGKIKDTTSSFIIVEEKMHYKIVYHKDTKVMYVVSTAHHNKGNFTVMLDEYGLPMLYEEEEDED